MNKTINDLEQITTVSTSDELPIFSEGETKKVTVGQLRDIKDVYSTEETLTNKVWIDGKLIYRKCKSQQTYSGAGTNNVFDLGLNGVIDSLVSLRTVTKQSNGEQICDYYNSTSALQNCYLKSDGTIQYRAGSSYSYGETTVIVEYTKTTD